MPRALPLDLLPAALVVIATAAALAYLRLAPAANEPVAAVFRPGLGLAAATSGLPAEWRVLGVAAVSPLPVLLLRRPAGSGSTTAAPAGAWLLLRASAAGQCLSLSNQRI